MVTSWVAYATITIGTIIIGAGGKCPEPKVAAINGQVFTERDNKVGEIAKEGCKRKYGEDSCLTKLVKTGPSDYRAYCAKVVVEEGN